MVSKNYINSLRYKDDDELVEIYEEAIGSLPNADEEEKEEVAAEVRAIITADTFKQAVYLAETKFGWGDALRAVQQLWKEIGRLYEIRHSDVTKIAEELTDQLSRDREELANFVTKVLTRGYEDDPDSFFEDWESYVAE